MNGTFTFSIDKQLISKRKGPCEALFNGNEIPGCREADCFTSMRTLAFHTHCQYIMTKEKESLRHSDVKINESLKAKA